MAARRTRNGERAIGEEGRKHRRQEVGRPQHAEVGQDSGCVSADAAPKQAQEVASRLVYVEWVDSYGCSAVWQALAVDRPEPMLCRSVGWLVHDGKDCKVVVPHVARGMETPQGCGDMTIPTAAIVKLADLVVPA